MVHGCSLEPSQRFRHLRVGQDVAEGQFGSCGIHHAVQFVPVAGEPRLVRLRGHGPTRRGLEFVSDDDVGMVGEHEVLGRGCVTTKWIQCIILFRQAEVGLSRRFARLCTLPTHLVLARGRGPLKLGNHICLVESCVFTCVQDLESVAGQLHELQAVSPLALRSSHEGVHLLVAEASRFEAHAAGHLGIGNGGRHEVQRATRGLGSEGDLASPFADLHALHPRNRGEVIRGRRGVGRWGHQHPILHQRDPRRPFRSAAAHADIGPEAKPILRHHVHPRQRVERPNGISVGHLPKRLGRKALHGSRNFTRV